MTQQTVSQLRRELQTMKTLFRNGLLGLVMGLLSAGDALLQAIALQLPCVAAPVSKDQPKRLAMCSAQGLVHAAPLNRNTLTAQAVALLNDEQQWASIQNALQERAQLHSQDFIAKQFQELLAL